MHAADPGKMLSSARCIGPFVWDAGVIPTTGSNVNNSTMACEWVNMYVLKQGEYSAELFTEHWLGCDGLSN